MKTYYMKRAQAHINHWGIQVSCVQTELIRITVIGSTKKEIWEWVGYGREIDEANKQRLLKNYAICKFQYLEELAYRAVKNRKATGQTK